MRTLESALRDSAKTLREEASRLPDRRWAPPEKRHGARGVLIGLSVAAIVLVVFAVPGWLVSQPGGDLSNSSPSLAAPSEPTDSLADSDLVNPLLEFQSGGLSSDEFHNQTQRALSSCMQERGWTHEPSLQNSAFPEPRTVGELREFRHANGYGLYTQPESTNVSPAKRAADRNHDYYTSLDEEQQAEYRQDLNGDITSEGEEPVDGSCEALAEHAVDIPLTDEELMGDMRSLYSAAHETPEYVSAEDDWRACLADRGYDIERDGHPVNLVDDQAAAETPPQELANFEVAIAVDDFECALTTTMPVRHRMETEIVDELVEKYPKWHNTREEADNIDERPGN